MHALAARVMGYSELWQAPQVHFTSIVTVQPIQEKTADTQITQKNPPIEGRDHRRHSNATENTEISSAPLLLLCVSALFLCASLRLCSLCVFITLGAPIFA